MITWIQRFFLKHNKWLFGSLLVVIVVTFVLTIGPQSFFDGPSSRQQTKLSFYGYDLASPVDQQKIFDGAEVSAMLNPELQLRREQLSDYAYIRIAGLGIARQMGIPAPTQDQLTEYIREKPIFQDRESGEFSAEVYNQILDSLGTSDRFSKKILARVLKEDYQIKTVREALSGPFIMLPKEIEADYIATKSIYDFSIARRSFTDFETELEVDESEAQAYYDENPAQYEVPERIQATAILFNAKTYLDDVPELSEEEIELYFTRNKSRYQPRAAEDESIDPVTLDAVRDQVIADLRLSSARKTAEKRSESFTLALWEKKIERTDPQFDALVESFGASQSPIAPYARTSPPALPNVPRQLLNSLWTFTSGNRYFSEIGQSRDGAVVLTIDKIIPASIPTFEEIKDKVIADYRNDERTRIFIAEGPIVKEELVTALASSESTEAAVNEAGLEFEAVESFEGLDIPALFQQNNLWQQSRYLNNGEVSDMIFSGTHGIFVIVDSIERPALDKSSEAYQTFAAEQSDNSTAGIGWARLSEISATAIKALGLNP